MKILLTGATGQVGSALWKPLAQFGAVVAPDRKGLDLSRPDRIAGVLDNISPDLIINLGAYTAVDLAEDEHELAFRVNEGAPRALAQWAFHHDIPVIHLSTDYVFDGSGDRPWKESDSTGPLSIYGASKLAGELAIKKTGCAHLILRTSWVFASKGRNFLNTIVRLARERPELRVVADQIGAPTSARAIADGLVSILRDHSRQQDLERVFNSVRWSRSHLLLWRDEFSWFRNRHRRRASTPRRSIGRRHHCGNRNEGFSDQSGAAAQFPS